MKITTTFTQNKELEFSALFYIHGNNNEVIFETDLRKPLDSYNFFKHLSQFSKSQKVLKTLNVPYEKKQYYQFAVMHEGKIFPIKWFDLVVNNSVVISHDIAFETTLISKNNVIIPFGYFPMRYWGKSVKLPKNREFNIKYRAYKFIANQIKKTFI